MDSITELRPSETMSNWGREPQLGSDKTKALLKKNVRLKVPDFNNAFM